MAEFGLLSTVFMKKPGVSGVKGGGILKAGVPAFSGGLIDQHCQFFFAGVPDIFHRSPSHLADHNRAM